MVHPTATEGSRFFKPNFRQLLMLVLALGFAIAGLYRLFWRVQPQPTVQQVSVPANENGDSVRKTRTKRKSD